MSERLALADFLLIAEAVLETPAEDLARTVLIGSAESALAAPFATFAGIVFYDEAVERAAICCSRSIRNQRNFVTWVKARVILGEKLRRLPSSA